jgi:hypothetical protein
LALSLLGRGESWRGVKSCHMSAEAEIRRRIRERGPITFAEFMELVLFWPQGGYYLQREPIGPSGDYYTSPLVHPAFGAGTDDPPPALGGRHAPPPYRQSSPSRCIISALTGGLGPVWKETCPGTDRGRW